MDSASRPLALVSLAAFRQHRWSRGWSYAWPCSPVESNSCRAHIQIDKPTEEQCMRVRYQLFFYAGTLLFFYSRRGEESPEVFRKSATRGARPRPERTKAKNRGPPQARSDSRALPCTFEPLSAGDYGRNSRVRGQPQGSSSAAELLMPFTNAHSAPLSPHHPLRPGCVAHPSFSLLCGGGLPTTRAIN